MPLNDICWFYVEDGAAAASNKKMRGTWCANCGCKIGRKHTRNREETDVFTGNAPPLGIIATLNGLALANNVCSGFEDCYWRKLPKNTENVSSLVVTVLLLFIWEAAYAALTRSSYLWA